MSPELPIGYRWRSATDADGPAVRDLVFAVLREYGLCPDPDGVDNDLIQLEASYIQPGGWFGVVLTGSEAIIGSAGMVPLGDGVVELRKMYLHPDHRGRGLGSAILRAALADARRRGLRRVTLETATVLREAIGLYERHGFQRRAGTPHACRCDVVMDLDIQRLQEPEDRGPIAAGSS